MVINFKEFQGQERPVLILKNLNGDELATLGYAINPHISLSYNEVSELSFDLPAFADGEAVPYYQSVVGMRIVELQGVGQFLLSDPSERDTGKSRVKSCKAYSLEYEFTFKKISMPQGTYEFYNAVGFEDSIIGRIQELMPHWTFEVDDRLIGRYRTFEVNGENLYHFMKNTVQTSYQCIFDFDTTARRVRVREVNHEIATKSVYLSTGNLIRELKIDEDTESIITCLDVNGAEGVNIRDVNPIGSNKIYNLDYFLSEENFSPALIQKWKAWELACREQQEAFYRGNLELDAQKAAVLAEQARLEEYRETLAEQESLHSVRAEKAAANPQSEEAQQELKEAFDAVDKAKKAVAAQEEVVSGLEARIESLEEEIREQTMKLKPGVYFTAEEWAQFDRYIKEDALTESSFAMSTTTSYTARDKKQTCEGTFLLSEGEVTKITTEGSQRLLYSVKGGILAAPEELGAEFPAKVVNATLEITEDGKAVFSALLNLPVTGSALNPDSSREAEASGQDGQRMFRTACLSMVGSCADRGADGSVFKDDAVFPQEPSDPDKEPTEPLNAYGTGTYVQFPVQDAFVYMTTNATEYEQRSVSFSLYEYGVETLEKLAYPSYTFSVDSANFLVLQEFEEFKNQLALGERVFLELDDERVLEPFVIGLEYSFDDPTSFSITFSDKYCASDAAFRLVDLLEQSVSMGKSVDFSKYTYRAFVDSGAQTEVRSFMDSALDVSKNAVLSSQNQAISWDESGLKLRKWADENDHSKGYEDDQIAMINNNIVFTDNGFETVKMAIGRFEDPTRNSCFGIVAPNIVGTLMAGENLRIECKDEKGKTILFQVDEQGAKLHNAEFDIITNTLQGQRQIVLNPDIGIAMGAFPVYDESGFNKDNASFYIDAESGDAFFKGTIKAAKYLDENGNEMMVENSYKFSAKYLDLHGLTIKDKSGTTTFQIDQNGHVTMQGDITINNGAPDGTFISGTNIYAPMIRSPQIIWYESSDPTGNTELGRIEEGPGNDGSGSSTVLLKMTSWKGISLWAKEGGMSLDATKGIWLNSLTTAQKGLSVRGTFSIEGKGSCPSLTDKDGWVNVESALGKLEKRISDLEKKN